MIIPRNKSNTFLFILMSLGSVYAAPLGAHASLNLSVNPAEGGNTLRLGRVDGTIEVNKAVKLRITTDDGKQYQVFQRLEDSLTNERQQILDTQALKTYAISGSNASGTLYGQANEPLSFTDQLVYTSSPDGQSDGFNLVYMVNPEQINASGNFTGRIAYTVRSLGEGRQEQSILNVYLEASADLKLSLKGLKYSDRVKLESNSRSNNGDGIKVNFSGNWGDEIRIYQEVVNFPQNELGQDIANDALEFTTEGAKGELRHPSGEALGRKRELIYKSKESEDEFAVNYFLKTETLQQLKAGIYRGRIVLTVESIQGSQEFTFDIDVQVDPVFELKVTLPPQGVRFSHVLPTDPPQTQEVDVKVETNLGKPYLVLQNVATPLTNPKGNQIKNEYFTLKTEPVCSAEGKLGAPEFVPVGAGETPVFFSNRQGSPAEFKVLYRLKSYPEITAGDYAAPIVFSLGEM